MEYKKIFFPIGGGEELRERIHGSLIIAKYFNAHLEIFKSLAKPSQIMQFDDKIPETLLKELNAIAKDRLEEDMYIHETIFKEEIEKIGSKISNIAIPDTATAQILSGEGYRSKLIEQESKYCDLVIVSSPHNGRLTSTFETTIVKSGKPALMFPRKMKDFSTNKIIIGWNNSAEGSRAISLSIPLLKKAKEVHIITASEYIKEENDIQKLQNYLAIHDIIATYEIVKITKTPGEALLKNARDGEFDLIIAGAFGDRGFRELMFGGTTKYILENTNIPIFMSN